MTIKFRQSFRAATILPLLCFHINQSALFAHEGDDETTTVTGKLTVIQADDFDHGRNDIFYIVEDLDTGRKYHIRFESGPPGPIETGAKVTVRGKSNGNEIVVSANGSNFQTVEVVASAVTGVQKTVVLTLNFADAPLECSVPS